MSMVRTSKSLFYACILTFVLAPLVQAQTFNILFAFDFDNGAFPNSVIQGRDGDLYGTTSGGGLGCDYQGEPYGCGTIFRLTRDGHHTTLRVRLSRLRTSRNNAADAADPDQ